MRLRTLSVASAAACCGFALLFAATPPASAATGDFIYAYPDPYSGPQLSSLTDPPSRVCITLPEVAEPWTAPAHSPANYTDSTATVFTDADCEGDYFSLRPQGGHASERLKLRSVVFS